MSKQQLFALFACNLVPFTVGNGLMALLPIYISNELGAGSVVTGFAFAFSFALLVMSTTLSAPLARRLHRYRDVITVSALICIPAVWLAGQVDNVLVVMLLLSLEWFFGGLVLAIVQIITALGSDQNQRGRVFGLLVTVGPLSQIIGGLSAGAIVTLWGFEALFLACAALYVLPVIVSRYIVDPQTGIEAQTMLTSDETSSPDASSSGVSLSTVSPLPVMLLIIMGASILAHIASFTISMARPLAMDALNFDANAVTSAVTISGLVTLALPFLAGWLSDRIGRQTVFVGTYLLAATGAVVYIFAGTLWQFWLAQALVSMLSASMAVGSALVTDHIPRDRVDTSISRFATTPWIGAVIGFTGAGFAVEQLGTTRTFALASLLFGLAIMLVISVNIPRLNGSRQRVRRVLRLNAQ